jgi:NAD(P)-dependent dehydrogenase (short-subunit alcohol dehydrogenase family)
MISTYGAIDSPVNNAGLQQDAPFPDITLAQWKKVIGINVTGISCARNWRCANSCVAASFPACPAAGKIICVSVRARDHSLVGARQLRLFQRRRPRVHAIAGAGARA